MNYRILLRVAVIFITYHLSLTTSSAQAQNDRDCIRKGNRLYRGQQYGKAEAEYRKALSHNGQNAQAHYNLGCALLMQQKDS
ncbi:MAG: tetratricopeptide repeat protein, partial [Prevotella sp.]|nr:tetratricopeptide repeat protein [Prevotella sp.]